jgi:hypothetical protein
MKSVEDIKVDKAALSVLRLTDAPDEKFFRIAKSPYDRLRAVETLRQLNYGYRQSTARLQRVLEIAQRTSR